MKRTTSLLTLTLLLLMLASCGGRPTPKPTAYMRFDLPEKDYQRCDTAFLPFTFECPKEADFVITKDLPYSKCWSLEYPQYNGVAFLSYRPIRGAADLKSQIDTSYRLLSFHFNYSSGVDEKQYTDTDKHIYATTYRIDGHNVACTYQFWATDSSRHFLRGALYLDCSPNNDSLAPILQYLQNDLSHLIETIEWRN